MVKTIKNEMKNFKCKNSLVQIYNTNLSWRLIYDEYQLVLLPTDYTDFLKVLHKNNKSYELSFLYKYNHLGKSAKSVGNKFGLKPKNFLYKKSGLKSAPIDINFEKYGQSVVNFPLQTSFFLLFKTSFFEFLPH